jgi:potassium efflux system protein
LTLISRELRDAINELDAIKQRLSARETTAHLIRLRLEEIAQRLDVMSTFVVPVTIDLHAPPTIAEALQWKTVAEQIALIAERRAQEANLDSQPARFSALRAKAAVLELKVKKYADIKRTLENIERQVLLDLTVPESLGIGLNSPVHEIAARLTLDSKLLRDQRLDIEDLVDSISTNQDKVDRVTRVIEDRFTTARRVVDFASDSDVLGKVLLAYWQEMEEFRLPTPADRLPQQLGNTVISRIQHDETLSELVSATSYITVRISVAGLDPIIISAADKGALIELARYKRKLLRDITHMESEYIEALRELSGGYTHLKDLVKEYKEYLGALILWIPSRQLLWKSNFGNMPAELDNLLSALIDLTVTTKPLFFIALFTIAILVLAGTRLRKANHAEGSQPFKPRSDSIGDTIVALLVAALRASPTPAILFAISILFSQNTSLVSAALFNTLNGLIVVVFVLDLMRILSEEFGIARTHFGWRSQTCGRLYTETSWLIRWWLPVATLASFLFLVGDDTVLLGRLTLLFVLFLLGGHLVKHVCRDMQTNSGQFLLTGENRLRLVLIVILIAVIVGVFWGLRYSVSIITGRLVATLWIGVGLLIVYNLLLRWLYLVRRRLFLAEQQAVGTEQSIGGAHSDEEEEANLVNIGVETRRLLNMTTLSAAVVALLYLWTPLFPVVGALTRVTLWTSTSVIDGESSTVLITLGTLILIIFLVAITFYAARRLPALAELALRSRTNITRGGRYAASTLLSYGIVGIGTVIALSALGLRWSQLQWLIAALGVGIGFGLQEIIANFVSGLIILFERPIRVGDLVTVGDKDGIVTRIRIRATTIRDFDGKELLVPNKEFITGRLLNWSLTDSNVRLVIPVGIAYGSDLDKALSILKQITDEYPGILADPAPSIILGNFGESSLDLTARFFIGSFDDYWPLTTEIRREIYKKFNEAGIVIAHPQRDIHFDSEQPIRVSIDAPQDN